ncbi:MAG: tetratricopeptide repeat protein [Bacteroidetes bacterium]|nr:tetratricopeptide repeat protein [Bacteroidota bacterium]
MASKIKSFLLLLCIACSSSGSAQSNTDSLQAALKTAAADTQKVNILYELAVRQDEPETKQKYANELLKLSEDLSYTKGIAWGYNLLGAASRSQGNYADALDNYTKSLKVAEARKDSLSTAKVNNNIGEIHRLLGEYPAALSYYLKSLAMLEKLNKPRLVATSMNNIAIIYRYQENYDKALDYNRKSLAIREKLQNKQEMADSYDNMGIIYYEQKQYSEAIKNVTRALELKIEVKDTIGIASSYNNISNVYSGAGDQAKAMEYQMKALAMREYMKDKRGIAMSYNNLGNIYNLLGDYTKAMDYQLKALALARKTGSRELVKDTYESLVALNKNKKDFEQAFYYQGLLSGIKDSILNTETNKQIAEMQAKYEAEKKDLAIGKQSIELERNKLEIFRQKTQRNILLISVIILAVIIFLLYNRHKLKQKNLLQAERSEQQLLRTKAIVEAEENERTRIARELHDGIGQQLSAVKLNLSSLQSTLDNSNTQQSVLMKNAIEIIDDSVKEVRSVSHSMMPNALLKSGLATAVREFLNKISNTGKLKIELEISGLNERLESMMENILFRVVQETVNNIIRHSGASVVNIQIIRYEDELSMMIEDNGVGFDPVLASSGIGLKNIRSRIEFLNGTVNVDSSPGKGTTIIIEVPLGRNKAGLI